MRKKEDKSMVACDLCPTEYLTNYLVVFSRHGLEQMANHMREKHNITEAKNMPVKLVEGYE